MAKVRHHAAVRESSALWNDTHADDSIEVEGEPAPGWRLRPSGKKVNCFDSKIEAVLSFRWSTWIAERKQFDSGI